MRLAYSTDLDDAFMFWPLATGRMDPRDFGFSLKAFHDTLIYGGTMPVSYARRHFMGLPS